MTDKDKSFIVRCCVSTLAFIIGSTYLTLLLMLYHNADTKLIFNILGPTVSTIVGAFVGILGVIKMEDLAIKKAAKEIGPNESNGGVAHVTTATNQQTPMGASEGSDIAPTIS